MEYYIATIGYYLQNREAAIESEFSYKSCLPPPMPPVAPNPSKLRRISSSTLSLSGRTKKKLLTVSFKKKLEF